MKPNAETASDSARVGESTATTRWDLVRHHFFRAVDLAAAERDDYLDDACAGHPTLRAAIDSLLAVDEETGSWLRRGVERSAQTLSLPLPGVDWSGRRLGPYRLVRLLGRGGMGAVFLAERCDGEYEQRVAIKLVPTGLVDDELRDRFLVERQILAGLEHPNIVRFLGGGTTPEGLPYVVMEWVDGEPLIEFCRQRRLDLEARLGLFDQVLGAVAHAHRHLIIHRDLKPSNLLVTNDASVKLLDFGIAKLLDDGLGDPTAHSGRGPMTPAYASPEQRLGRPVTTASDVYALGVVLYELLSGERPHVAAGADPSDPASEPSSRPASGPARPSRIAPRPMARRLRGDLDRIVLKAVAADPEDRYATASAFADDLQRWRRHRPVAATPARPFYLSHRFMRRHRAGLVALGLLIGALAWGVLAERREALAARQAEAETQVVVDFLVGMFDQLDPGTGEPPATLDQAVEIAAERLAADPRRALQTPLSASPSVRARLQHALGRVYWTLGDYSRAADLLEDALALRESADDPDEPGSTRDLAATLYELGRTYQLLGRDDEAEAVMVRSLDLYRRHDDRLGTAKASAELSVLYAHRGRFDEAETLARGAVAIGEEIDAPAGQRATHFSILAMVLRERGETAESLELGARALALRRVAWGDDHPDIATSLNGQAIAHALEGRLERAGALFEEALAIRQRILPPNHASLGQSHGNLGRVELELGRLAAARHHAERALEIFAAASEPNLRRLGGTRSLLARVEAAAGRFDAAERSFVAARAELEEALGPDHGYLVEPLAGLAALYCGGEDPARAIEGGRLYDRAIELKMTTGVPGLLSLEELEAARAECSVPGAGMAGGAVSDPAASG